MNRIFFAASLAGGLALSSGAMAQNLVQNGDFSQGAADWTAFVTGIPNTPDSVQVNPSSAYGLSCYTANCVNLEVNANAVDTVYQDVSGFNVGDTYTLTFGYGGRNVGGVQGMDVLVGGVELGALSSGVPVWNTETYSFVATDTSEILSFAAQDISGETSLGNEVAGVAITDTTPVPEPASFALMAAGLLGWVGTWRAKGRKLV